MKALFLIGRLAFGGFFLYNGINHFKQRQILSQYAGSKNVPNPDLAVIGSGLALAIGGASIMLGVKPKIGTLSIIGFLAGASPVMHNFWAIEDPNQRMRRHGQLQQKHGIVGSGSGACRLGRALAGERPYRLVARCSNGRWPT